MNMDFSKSLGLGLTTAVVCSYGLFHRAFRQQPVSKKLIKADLSSTSSINKASDSINDANDSKSTAPSQEDGEDNILTNHSRNISTRSSPNRANRSDAANLNVSMDDALYNDLLQENEELKRKLNEIMEAQRQNATQLPASTTPKTAASNEAKKYIEESTKLRMDLTIAQSAGNAAQDQVIALQQQLQAQQRKISKLLSYILGDTDRNSNAASPSLDDALRVAKETRDRASAFQNKCLALEEMHLEKNAAIVDLREQLSSYRLSKVQEITALRNQLLTTEENARDREEQLLHRIAQLETKLISYNAEIPTLVTVESLRGTPNRARTPTSGRRRESAPNVLQLGSPASAAPSPGTMLNGFFAPEINSTDSNGNRNASYGRTLTPNQNRRRSTADGKGVGIAMPDTPPSSSRRSSTSRSSSKRDLKAVGSFVISPEEAEDYMRL